MPGKYRPALPAPSRNTPDGNIRDSAPAVHGHHAALIACVCGSGSQRFDVSMMSGVRINPITNPAEGIASQVRQPPGEDLIRAALTNSDAMNSEAMTAKMARLNRLLSCTSDSPT